jgi:hypothetical protein
MNRKTGSRCSLAIRPDDPAGGQSGFLIHRAHLGAFALYVMMEFPVKEQLELEILNTMYFSLAVRCISSPFGKFVPVVSNSE